MLKQYVCSDDGGNVLFLPFQPQSKYLDNPDLEIKLKTNKDNYCIYLFNEDTTWALLYLFLHAAYWEKMEEHFRRTSLIPHNCDLKDYALKVLKDYYSERLKLGNTPLW